LTFGLKYAIIIGSYETAQNGRRTMDHPLLGVYILILVAAILSTGQFFEITRGVKRIARALERIAEALNPEEDEQEE